MNRVDPLLRSSMTAAVVAACLLLGACAPADTPASDVAEGAASAVLEGSGGTDGDESVAPDMEGDRDSAGDTDADASSAEDAGDMAETMITQMMIGAAVERGRISEEDANLYQEVDAILADFRPEGEGNLGQGLPREERLDRQRAAAEAAVEAGVLDEDRADRFVDLFALLQAEGLVP